MISHTHKSYPETMDVVDSFNKNTEDVDDQLKDLITSYMQIQDVVGGMDGGDVGLGDGPEVGADADFQITVPLYFVV